jgi:hypothetical protein
MPLRSEAEGKKARITSLRNGSLMTIESFSGFLFGRPFCFSSEPDSAVSRLSADRFTKNGSKSNARLKHCPACVNQPAARQLIARYTKESRTPSGKGV